MIRVVVVDDEALVRSGIELILRAAGDIDVVATADGRDAMWEISLHRPDVVLLDIRMPGVDGLTILTEVRALPDPPAVAMLTTFDTDEHIASALRTGAAGFLLKDTDPGQLARAVRALAGGAVVLSPSAARLVGDSAGVSRAEAAARIGRLSEWERHVLTLVAEGASNDDIALGLALSVHAVTEQVKAILGKLMVNSRMQAALLAQAAGLLDEASGP
ncbi:response regulator [Amycolatopsis pigmentata]|uniref:Response regulator n=1 Tax=Amycolatopsis pigmentata TaxID=450801 RepID=A0ABW5G024_9PSEU